jgi:hypothetical protein
VEGYLITLANKRKLRKKGGIMEKRLNRNKILKMAIILLIMSVTGNAIGFCTAESCPYTYIDCAQCCKAGRFVSDECVRACNCTFYNDSAWAESKDFPH